MVPLGIPCPPIQRHSRNIPEVGKLGAGEGPEEDAAHNVYGSADDLPICLHSSGGRPRRARLSLSLKPGQV
jgi:hypothetical protein